MSWRRSPMTASRSGVGRASPGSDRVLTAPPPSRPGRHELELELDGDVATHRQASHAQREVEVDAEVVADGRRGGREAGVGRAVGGEDLDAEELDVDGHRP